MRKIAVAALALSALATTFAPAASAAPPGPTDSGCSFTSVSDPNPEAPADTQTGYIQGGPIVGNGKLTCTIKVGVGTVEGAYVNGASASATGSNGVTVLPPTIVSYVSPSRVPVYMCEVWVDPNGAVWYYDGQAGAWVEPNSGVQCTLAISGGTDDPLLDPIWDLLESLDPAICGVLMTLRDTLGLTDPDGLVYIAPDGDLYVAGIFIWDCPPYVEA